MKSAGCNLLKAVDNCIEKMAAPDSKKAQLLPSHSLKKQPCGTSLRLDTTAVLLLCYLLRASRTLEARVDICDCKTYPIPKNYCIRRIAEGQACAGKF